MNSVYSTCRGEMFRKVLLRVSEVSSLLPEAANIMVLTAMATTSLRLEVTRIMGMTNPLEVLRSPCKPKMMYAVVPFATIAEVFYPVVERLRLQRFELPRMIIYCRQFQKIAQTFTSTPVSSWVQTLQSHQIAPVRRDSDL